MKEYLPEWKIYLWKKLILNQPDPAKSFCADNFMYFNEQEQRTAWLDDAQTQINRMKRVEWLSSRVKVTKFDTSSDTPSNKRYFAFSPKEILLAFIELAQQEPVSLEMSDITADKDFIAKYKELRKKYLEKFEGILPDDGSFSDPLCGLSKGVYKKIKESQKLTLEELIEVVNATSEMPLLEMVSFKLKVDAENLSTHLNAYIDEFISGNLVPYKNVRYFQFDRQKKALLDSLLQMAKDFGPKNITATFDQLGNSGAWTIDDQHHYRFYETLFALERIGEIEVKDIRGSEVVVSLKQNVAAPEAVVEKVGNFQEMNGVQGFFKLKSPLSWDEIHIKFCDEDTISIYREDKNIATCKYWEIGFSHKDNKLKKVNSWGFLLALSVYFPEYKNASVKNLSKHLDLPITPQGKNQLEALKLDCKKRLCALFGKSDDPFTTQQISGSKDFYYKPVFHLYSLPDLRRKDPVNNQEKDFDDNTISEEYFMDEPTTSYLNE